MFSLSYLRLRSILSHKSFCHLFSLFLRVPSCYFVDPLEFQRRPNLILL